MPDELSDLFAMANMYASACTKQREKYRDFQCHGYAWRWEDCQAAYELVRELPDYWELSAAWRAAHVCRSCGFPHDAHAGQCREVAHGR